MPEISRDTILEAEGVTVRRPTPYDFSKPYSTPDFEIKSGCYALMPRDVLLVIGDQIIGTPMGWRSRYHENHAYKPLCKEYFRKGAGWVSAPRPQLSEQSYVEGFVAREEGEPTRTILTEFEPLFDAVDVIKCGKDIWDILVCPEPLMPESHPKRCTNSRAPEILHSEHKEEAMPYTYAVLGAGRQGTAAAYDMARWGDAGRVVLADYDLEVAQQAAGRVNESIGKPTIAEPVQLDVTDLAAVERVLTGVDAFLSAVPYYYNLDITRVAARAGASMCDLGGHTGIARQQHGFDAEARAANISIIPNCGQVPGMGTSLMVYAMELLDEAVDVYMWDGGIPQDPRPPFNYLLTFHVAGLTNEYAEPAIFVRNWKVTAVEPMTEPEMVEFPEPIGTLEAFVAGGGTDTMPWTYEGRLRTLQNLTLRYPGHFAQLRAFYDLGLWDLEPIQVGDVEVVPRDVFHALFEPKVTFPEDKDVVIIRVKAIGKKDSQDAEAIVEVIDHFDEETRFTAMERGTGWSAAIVAEMMARGETPRGAGGVETMVPARPFVEQLRHRAINVTEQVRFLCCM